MWQNWPHVAFCAGLAFCAFCAFQPERATARVCRCGHGLRSSAAAAKPQTEAFGRAAAHERGCREAEANAYGASRTAVRSVELVGDPRRSAGCAGAQRL